MDNTLVCGPTTGPATVLLAHGAGAGMESPFMLHMAEGRDKMVKVSFKEDRKKRIELIELLQNSINSTLVELVGKTATFSLIK